MRIHVLVLQQILRDVPRRPPRLVVGVEACYSPSPEPPLFEISPRPSTLMTSTRVTPQGVSMKRTAFVCLQRAKHTGRSIQSWQPLEGLLDGDLCSDIVPSGASEREGCPEFPLEPSCPGNKSFPCLSQLPGSRICASKDGGSSRLRSRSSTCALMLWYSLISLMLGSSQRHLSLQATPL